MHVSRSCEDSTDVDWECERLPAESRTPQNKMLPGSILRELLRVVEPFAHNRERSCLEPTEHVDVVEMTRHGLVCHSPEGEWVSFDAQGLTESPLAIPVGILAEVRRFARNLECFYVSADYDRQSISDGDGTVVSWRTPLPVDVDADACDYVPELDQVVATVPSAKLESALECLKSRLPCADTVAVLRISRLIGQLCSRLPFMERPTRVSLCPSISSATAWMAKLSYASRWAHSEKCSWVRRGVQSSYACTVMMGLGSAPCGTSAR